MALGFISGNLRCLIRMLNLRMMSHQNGSSGIVSDGQQKDDMPDASLENPYLLKKMECILCRLNITPDYKNVRLLSQFISPYTGRIYGRHITQLCARQQDKLVKEIAKAQSAGLMAYYMKDVAFVKDCKLFDPARPIRPHRF